MNDVVFEVIAIDLFRYAVVVSVIVCLRVQYLKFKAVLMRKGLKGICKIA